MGRQKKDNNYQEIIVTPEELWAGTAAQLLGRNGQTETLQPEVASSQYTYKSIQVYLGSPLSFPF